MGLGIPEWNKSTSLKLPIGKSQLKVEMGDPGSTKIVYRDLLLTKDATGLITGNLQEIWPEPNYLSIKRGKVKVNEDIRQYIDNSDFTGAVLIYDLKGKFTKGRFYLAGTIADEVVPQSDKRLVKTENVDLPESFCSVHLEHPGCKWFRDQLGITLPEVEVTAPRIKPTPDPDFTGFPQISNPVGGASGQNSITDIKTDKIKNQCLVDAISRAFNKGLKNKITTAFNNLFSGTDDFDINFKEGPLDKSTYATTQAVGRYDIDITLNNTLLPNASNELTVATILHEAVHAMYNAKGITIGANKFSFSEYVQHNLMADKYVDEITSALREIFPTLPEYDAKALAWEGLQDGASWKALDPNEANKLLLAGDEYDETHKKGSRCSQ